MDEQDWLAEQFNESRAHLRMVALRLLGSASEAEDAVQESWIKLSRSDTGEVENLRAWLTTVVARVCLDMLRSRSSRREDSRDPGPETPSDSDPESELAFAQAIGPALLIVLEMLTPGERLAFVLHDMFDLSFEEIAPILERTPAAVRQLASRARRRVRGSPEQAPDADKHRELVSAFLAASREGSFEKLVALLDPNAVLRADALAVRVAAENRKQGAPSLAAEVRGSAKIAEVFKGRARGASQAWIDGRPGAVWAMGGQVRSAFLFKVVGNQIAGIDLVMDPAHLAEFEIQVNGSPAG